jgi:hemoglobin
MSDSETPFALLGGADRVRALVEQFYDIMSDREPALTRLHRCTPEGRVDRYSRDRFALFLIGWLGGPQDYILQHGLGLTRFRGHCVRQQYLVARTGARSQLD